MAGEILKTISVGALQPNGITFDGKYLWAVEINGDIILQYGVNGTIIQSFSAPALSHTDMTFDGKDLWLADANSRVFYVINKQGTIIKQFNHFPHSNGGVTIDSRILTHSAYNNRFYQMNRGGVDIREVILTAGYVIRGMCFDGKSFWITEDTNNKIICIDRNGTEKKSLNAPGTGPRGICFDGLNLWVTNIQAGNNRIDCIRR